MMTSKYTTYCGIATIVASTIATYNFSPLVTKISACAAAIATGIGLLLARDNKVSDEQAGAGNTISADLNTAGSIKNSAPVATVSQPVADVMKEKQ